MSQIESEIQKLSPSASVSLFTLDASRIGGSVLNFTRTNKSTAMIRFRGVDYQPIPIEFDGFEVNSAGALPRPTMKLSNTNGLIQAIVNTWGDLNGARVTRIRTFARFLDGEPEADPDAYIGPDVFEVDRKVSDTPKMVTWELAAAIDQQGRFIGRPVIRDTCLWRYRTWNPQTSSFDYAHVKCPYTGSAYYDENDLPVANPALDKPSRRLSCCKVRFGANNPLPTSAFPGVSRTLT